METPTITGARDAHARGCAEGSPAADGLGPLIAEARGGSAAALGVLLEHCRRYLLLIANDSLDSDLRAKNGASDLVQDTFLEAHRDFQRFEGTTEQELLAWLAKILAHRVSNNVRRYRTAGKRDVRREAPLAAPSGPAPVEPAGSSTLPVDGVIRAEEREQLHRALARLPDAMREVLIQRTWQRRSFVEIAERLATTPDAVRKQWGRALVRLQRELQHP